MNLITTKQACDKYKLSYSQLRNMYRQGYIKRFTHDGTIKVCDIELGAYIKSRRNKKCRHCNNKVPLSKNNTCGKPECIKASKNYGKNLYNKNNPDSRLRYKDTLKDSVLSLSSKGLSNKEVCEKLGVGVTFVSKTINANGLRKIREDKLLYVKFKGSKTVSKGKTTKFLIPCNGCGTKNFVATSSLNILDNEKRKYLCVKCDNELLNDRASSLKKKKNNTSGYIGVCIKRKPNGEPHGYLASLSYEGKKLLKNMYRDDYLKKSTLLRAAVDRDLFIIDRKLPHTRNFNDEELLNLIETVGIEELDAARLIVMRTTTV